MIPHEVSVVFVPIYLFLSVWQAFQTFHSITKHLVELKEAYGIDLLSKT